MELIKLSHEDGSWGALEDEWRAQCTAAGEDLEDWGVSFLAPMRTLIDNPHRRAGVYALKCGSSYLYICQANSAPLPSTTGNTLRVRFLTLCPNYDLMGVELDEYVEAIGSIFTSIIELSRQEGMRSDQIKFHLKSPADRAYFSAYSKALRGTGLFPDVAVRGSWFYITIS